MIRRWVVTPLALLILATACGSAGSSSTTATPVSAPSETTTAEPSTETTSTETTSPSSSSSAPTTSAPNPVSTNALAPDFPDLATCVARPWSLLAEQIDNVLETAPFASLPGFNATVTGEGLVEFKANGTYSYTPEYDVEISFLDQTGSGSWSGSVLGNWTISNDTLALSPTSDTVTGTMTIGGVTQPLPPALSFSGTARIIECKPVTFKYELDAPTGAFTHNLVAA